MITDQICLISSCILDLHSTPAQFWLKLEMTRKIKSNEVFCCLSSQGSPKQDHIIEKSKDLKQCTNNICNSSRYTVSEGIYDEIQPRPPPKPARKSTVKCFSNNSLVPKTQNSTFSCAQPAKTFGIASQIDSLIVSQPEHNDLYIRPVKPTRRSKKKHLDSKPSKEEPLYAYPSDVHQIYDFPPTPRAIYDTVPSLFYDCPNPLVSAHLSVYDNLDTSSRPLSAPLEDCESIYENPTLNSRKSKSAYNTPNCLLRKKRTPVDTLPRIVTQSHDVVYDVPKSVMHALEINKFSF